MAHDAGHAGVDLDGVGLVLVHGDDGVLGGVGVGLGLVHSDDHESRLAYWSDCPSTAY